MDFLLVIAWVSIVALQLADVTLAAAGVGRARGGLLPLLSELQDGAGIRHTPEEVADYRERLDALTGEQAQQTQQAQPVGLSANAWLWRRSPARLIPVLLSAVAVLLLFSLALRSPLFVVLLVLPVVSYVLALAAARASVTAAAIAHVENARQRREIEALIEEAARSSRKKTAGLGDRVTRALQILREQQADRT
jgi:hypothetical protein